MKVTITLDFDPDLYYPVAERESPDEVVNVKREVLDLITNIGNLPAMGVTNIQVEVE